MLCVVVCLAAGGAARADVESLKVDGTRFIINGKPTRLWGVRMAAAANRGSKSPAADANVGCGADPSFAELKKYCLRFNFFSVYDEQLVFPEF